MIDVSLKTEPLWPGWYTAEDSSILVVGGLHWRLSNRQRLWRPLTDIYETDEAFVVRVEVAGMREADFSINLQQRQLLISGVRGESRSDGNERRAYLQMEIPFGEFAIEVELPTPVQVEQVQATYQEGFLRVVLPKATSQNVVIITKE